MKPIKILLLAVALSFGGTHLALADTSITVEVKDASGNAVEGADVKIVDKDGNVVGEGTTGADGKYRRLYIGDNDGQEFTVTVANNGETKETKQEPTGGKTRVNVALTGESGGSSAGYGNAGPWAPIGGTDASLYDDAFGAASASFFGGNLTVPASSFLGTENGGVQRLGLVSTDDDETVVGGSIGVGFNTGWNIGKSKVYVGVGAYRWTADLNQEFDDIDPAGDDLLIPGPDGGLSGINVSGLFDNTVTNARYESEYEGHGFKGKIGARIPCSCGTVVTPFLGVRYAGLETDFRFTGMLPAVLSGLDFNYHTNVDVDTISPVFGAAVKGRFGGDFDWIGWGVGASGSVDFNDAEGTDRLTTAGAVSLDNEVKLENDDTTFGYTVGGGLRFGAKSPFSVSLGVRYSWTDNVPVVTRDGTNPSKLEFEDADAILGTVGLRWIF